MLSEMFMVKCIDNEDYNNRMTIGKKYLVINQYNCCYTIIDDLNIQQSLSKNRFEIVKELNIMEAVKMPIGTRFNFDVEFPANYIEVIKSMDNKKILCWDGHKFQKVPVVSTLTCEMKLTPI